MQTPRVSLHRGLNGRIGSLTTASSVNRAWALLAPSTGFVTVALTDPLIAECDPRLGNVLVIESEQFPHPWVGGITRVDESFADGTARLQVVSLDAILRDRTVASIAAYSGSVGSVFRQLLEDCNAVNDSGILVSDDVSASASYSGAFTDRTVYGALTALCQQTGHEWWIDYDVRPEGIRAVAKIAPARGDAVGVTITDGGGSAEIIESAIDLGGSFFAITGVAGQTSTLQAYTERDRVTRTRSSGFARPGASASPTATVHGYEIEHVELGGAPLTRRERAVVAENLRDQGALSSAVDVELGRPRGAERVLRMRLTSFDRDLWRACAIGNVVRVRSQRAYLGAGLDAPVRIVAVQPSEEIGDLVLTGQVLMDRAGS